MFKEESQNCVQLVNHILNMFNICGHFYRGDTMVVHISKVRREVTEIVSVVPFRVFVIRERVSFLAHDDVKGIKFEYVMVFYVSLLFQFFQFYLNLNLRRRRSVLRTTASK
jgi:hypothetical protein